MARKLGFSMSDVLAAAAAIADADGLAALSLAAVAERLGMRAPSLHHHVGSLDGLRRQLAMFGAIQLAAALDDAVDGLRGTDAIAAAARAYRAFARKHRGQMAAMLPAPKPGEDDELYQTLGRPVMVLTARLADLGIEGDDAIHAIRMLRSYLHGFVDLELRGGFGMPQKLQVSFERGLASVLAGLKPRPLADDL